MVANSSDEPQVIAPYQLKQLGCCKWAIRIVVPTVSGAWTLADEGNTILRMITVQYKTRRNGEHVFWVGRHASHSVRIDANQPGVYRWTITRDRQSVASGVAADRDPAANDAAAALAELSR
jgi:hypothetical protein